MEARKEQNKKLKQINERGALGRGGGDEGINESEEHLSRRMLKNY